VKREVSSKLVSEVEIVPIKPMNGLVAFASFIFDGSFYFSSIGIYTRPTGGYRLTYPTKKGMEGSFNIYHPINKVVADEIERAVIAKYEEIAGSYINREEYEE
jgi:stage V sporulation protein G